MPNATSRQVLRDAAAASYRQGAQRLQDRAVSGTLDVDEARPVPVSRAPRGRSATAQVENLAAVAAECASKIQAATVAEVRYYLGAMLAELAAAPAAEVAGVQYCGEQAEVTDAYRAGLLLAARLVADPEVDY